MKKFEELDDKMLESVVGGGNMSAEDEARAEAIKKFMRDYRSKCQDYARAGDLVPLIKYNRYEGKGHGYDFVMKCANAGDFHGALSAIGTLFGTGLIELSATYPDFAELLTRLDNLHNG